MLNTTPDATSSSPTSNRRTNLTVSPRQTLTHEPEGGPGDHRQQLEDNAASLDDAGLLPGTAWHNRGHRRLSSKCPASRERTTGLSRNGASLKRPLRDPF